MTSYTAYKAAPSQDSLRAVVDNLRPTIEYTLAGLNVSRDPVMRSKASLAAAEAIPKFDLNAGVQLPTFISSQLRALTRDARQSRLPVKLPDRAILDSYKLNMTLKRFEDAHGREPDTLELADASGLSVRRIEKVRRYQVSVPTEGAMGDMNAEMPDLDREALDYVMADADHTDRKILEHKTGYGGAAIIPANVLAERLRLTPSQLSRRSARLTLRINEIRDMLNKTAV